MRKLKIQFAAVAMAIAMARIRFGNISPSSTHITGPQDAPKNTTNRFAAIRVDTPQKPDSCGVSTPLASGTNVAWAKPSAITPRVRNMPAEPVSSSRRRPTRSTSRMATTVTTTLVTEVITDAV